MTKFIKINGRRIGPDCPVYTVAEMSANHNQSFEQAVKCIEAAKKAGADAIKVQTYTPETLTIDCDNEYFKVKGTIWDGRSLYELYSATYMPWDWQPRLKEAALKAGIDFFSTPFDETAVDFLESMDVPAFKIASFENVDLPLLRKTAQTGKPVILSTGMATLEEIDEAVRTILSSGGGQLALLKCTSAYPAEHGDMNLRTIPHLAETFNLPVGLSDHSLGTAVPLAAAAIGACIIEKHFTLSRAVPGPDTAFSLEPAEFEKMVEEIRIAEKALGTISYGVGKGEKETSVFRRSLFVVEDMKAGEPFTPLNLRSIRPGKGLHPRHLPEILGQAASRPIKRGTPLTRNLVK